MIKKGGHPPMIFSGAAGAAFLVVLGCLHDRWIQAESAIYASMLLVPHDLSLPVFIFPFL
jgi:hypothetical protein